MANPEVQGFVGGAYLFVPQCETFWMDGGSGQYGKSGKCMYADVLFDAIEYFAAWTRTAVPSWKTGARSGCLSGSACSAGDETDEERHAPGGVIQRLSASKIRAGIASNVPAPPNERGLFS